MNIQVDTFKTQTFDGVIVELEAVVGSDTARVTVPGLHIRYQLVATLPTSDAFRLYNKAFALTHKELLKEANFK
jgi:hypothetical protein